MPRSTKTQLVFTRESAIKKVRAAEDTWNTHDPEQVGAGYSLDSQWRNRGRLISGRSQIIEFLRDKWNKEIDYRLAKELWAFTNNLIAVRFQYEFRDATDRWTRAYGNELWEFDPSGLMRRREASINEISIQPSERNFRWPLGPRPESTPGIEDQIH